MVRWKEIAWTEEEIRILREVWPRESRRVILDRLPNRSWPFYPIIVGDT